MSTPVAWMGMRDEGTARVCSFCPDLAAAVALAKERGLGVTHGCCDACVAKEMAALDGTTRAVPEPLRAEQVACDVNELLLSEPRGVPDRPNAFALDGVAETITTRWKEGVAVVTRPCHVYGQPVQFFLLRFLAEQLGMESTKLGSFMPREWRKDEDMIATEHGVAIRESSLSMLVAELSTHGQSAAALALMRLLIPSRPGRTENLPAGCGGTVGFSGLGLAERTTAAPARAQAEPPKSRLLQWEEEHQ